MGARTVFKVNAWTTTEIAAVRRCSEEGMTAEEIGRRLGRTAIAVQACRRTHGIEGKGKPGPKARWKDPEPQLKPQRMVTHSAFLAKKWRGETAAAREDGSVFVPTVGWLDREDAEAWEVTPSQLEAQGAA